jgi:hypothetical protein
MKYGSRLRALKMSRRSFVLFAAVFGFFTSETVCADSIVMTIENFVAYIDGQIDQEQMAIGRAEGVGTKMTVEFFSKGDIVRLTHPDKKGAAVCERVQKSFMEDKYHCSKDMTLTLKTVGTYIRSGTMEGTTWKKGGTCIMDLTR